MNNKKRMIVGHVCEDGRGELNDYCLECAESAIRINHEKIRDTYYSNSLQTKCDGCDRDIVPLAEFPADKNPLEADYLVQLFLDKTLRNLYAAITIRAISLDDAREIAEQKHGGPDGLYVGKIIEMSPDQMAEHKKNNILEAGSEGVDGEDSGYLDEIEKIIKIEANEILESVLKCFSALTDPERDLIRTVAERSLWKVSRETWEKNGERTQKLLKNIFPASALAKKSH